MRRYETNSRAVKLLALLLSANRAASKTVVDVTDLPIFESLAGCAARAVTDGISSGIYFASWGEPNYREPSTCSDDVTSMYDCACKSYSDDVSSRMLNEASQWCGSTATDNAASAATVLSAYCNQMTDAAFPTPTHPVSSYVWELDYFSELAPCAGSALYGVMTELTPFSCPPEPTDMAPCVCDKDQNSARITKELSVSNSFQCSNNPADLTSIKNLFSAYCDMNRGTTSLPTTTPLPGPLSSYVHELPQYSSLNQCAQDALRYGIESQVYTMCPENGPVALASCVCLKDQMTKLVSSQITSYARYWCSTSAYLDNLSSAMSVYDYLCSAAEGEVTITATGDSAKETHNSGADDSRSGGLSAGVIAGAVVGSVVGVFIAAFAVCCFVRRRKGRRQGAADESVPLSSADMPLEILRQQYIAQPYRDRARERARTRAQPADEEEEDEIAPPPYEVGSYTGGSKT